MGQSQLQYFQHIQYLVRRFRCRLSCRIFRFELEEGFIAAIAAAVFFTAATTDIKSGSGTDGNDDISDISRLKAGLYGDKTDISDIKRFLAFALDWRLIADDWRLY